MSLTERDVLEALSRVRYPGFQRDIVAAGAVRDLRVEGCEVHLTIDVGAGDPALRGPIEAAVRETLERVEGVSRVHLGGTATAPSGSSALKMAGVPPPPSAAAAGGLGSDLIPHVRHVIAVASGKGGVGKSTVAVNLAVALAALGSRVGLLDADIYGPSIPKMTGIQEPPTLTPDRKLVPFERFGVSLMSLGFLVDPDSAVIWRGPMVMKALEQLLRDVTWGALDFLIVDMPPGTGDAQLTMSQRVSLAGAIIVTTPQDVALADVIKGVAMFRKVGVPVLGIVENMSYFRCPHCSERTEIFGHGGGRREAQRLDVPCLGEVPLDPSIRSGGDAGEPVVAAEPESAQARVFMEIARAVQEAFAPDAAGDDDAAGGSVFERFRRIWTRPTDAGE